MDALPDLVVHEILKSLSTREAVRASILSKQWQRVCYTVPVLDFDEDEIEQLRYDIRLRKLVEFVTMFLKRREKDESLQKLRLRMDMKYRGYETSNSDLVSKCLRFAMDRHVKELYLADTDDWNYSCSKSCFSLGNAHSLTSLSLESVNVTLLSAQHLTTLSLSHARIRNYSTITFPSLKSVSLNRVPQHDMLSDHLLNSRCPSIENLSIGGGPDMLSANIEISSSSLKSLEIISFPGNRTRLQVDAMNLVSLRVGSKEGEFSYLSRSSYHIDFASCGQLRNLELFGAEFNGVCAKEFTSRFPLLESLILCKCNLGEQIVVVCQHLKRFVLCQSRSKINAIVIDTPNLRSFWFDGPTDEFCLNAPNLYETTIMAGNDWWPWTHSTISKFLANFSSSEKVTLYAELWQLSIIPEEYTRRRPPLLAGCKHLEVIIKRGDTIMTPEMRDSLYRMAPSLETLSVNQRWFDHFM